MPGYLGALTLVLLFGMVLTRVLLLKRAGVEAMHFGRIDKSDFLIPPFALFYGYTIVAAAFHLPGVSRQRLFHSEGLAWAGVLLCFTGLMFLLLSLVAFGRSFRVGIDTESAAALITTGVFAVSRNPIYVAFGCVLLGQFLIFPGWVPLLYLVAGARLIHRQVLREEAFLRGHYGKQYAEYCQQVRRYI